MTDSNFDTIDWENDPDLFTYTKLDFRVDEFLKQGDDEDTLVIDETPKSPAQSVATDGTTVSADTDISTPCSSCTVDSDRPRVSAETTTETVEEEIQKTTVQVCASPKTSVQPTTAPTQKQKRHQLTTWESPFEKKIKYESRKIKYKAHKNAYLERFRSMKVAFRKLHCNAKVVNGQILPSEDTTSTPTVELISLFDKVN